MRKIATGLAMVLGCVILGSCAGASPAPTRPEYIAATDNVCDAAHADVLTMLQAQAARPNAADTEDSFIRFHLIPRLRSMIGTLSSIQTPANDQAYLFSIYTDYLAALGVWFAYPTGNNSLTARRNVETRLTDYGMTGCVKVPEARPGDPPPGKAAKTATTTPGA